MAAATVAAMVAATVAATVAAATVGAVPAESLLSALVGDEHESRAILIACRPHGVSGGHAPSTPRLKAVYEQPLSPVAARALPASARHNCILAARSATGPEDPPVVCMACACSVRHCVGRLALV